MSKANKILWGIIVVVVIILMILLSSDGRPEPVEGETVKIGVSLPLSGEASSWGEGGQGGINLAIKEINEKGGILGRNIELVFENNQCNPTEGAKAINKLINVDKVDSIVGIACSSVASASSPIAQNSKVPTIIAVSSAPNLPNVGDYIFRSTASDDLQGKYVAEYIFNELKNNKVAVLFTKNDWGQGLRDNFVSEFKKLGGEVLFDEGVNPSATDVKTEITKIKNSDAEILYAPVYANTLLTGLKQIKELGLDISVISGDTGGEDKNIQSTKEAEGLLYSLGKTNNPEDFQARVGAIHSGAINVATPLFYDAMYIMAEAIERAGSLDKKDIRDELAKTSYKNGISFPIVEFDENGDLKEAEFEVRIIKDGKSEVYLPR